MRRWLPRVALLLAGLLLIAGAGLWYLATSLDLVALEAELALAVRERTGHDLRLEGLELRPLPLPAIVLRGVELSAAPGFGPEPMVRVERAGARLRLLPLLRGELELGALRLEGLELRLLRSEAGRGSWQTLADHLQAQQGVAGSAELPPIQRLVLRDAQVSFEDAAAGRSLGLDLTLLELAPVTGLEPSRLRVLGELRCDEPAVEATFALLGTGVQDDDLLAVSRLSIDAVLQGDGVPGGELAVALSAPFELDLGTGALRVEPLELEASSLLLSGFLVSESGSDRTALAGELTAESADPRGLLRRFGREPALVDASALGGFQASTSFAWDGALLQLSELRVTVDDTNASGALSVASLDPPALWFQLDVDGLDLDRYATAGGKGGSAELPAGLGGAWLDGRLTVGRLRSGGLVLEALELPLTLQRGALRLDGASAEVLGGRVTGGLSADLGAEPPRYRVRGQATDLDLVRLVEASGSERDLTGRLDLDLDLLAAGRERGVVLASLDGRFCVSARDGSMPLTGRKGGSGVREGEKGWQARLAQERFAKVRERLVERATEKLDAKRPERLVFSRMGACFTLDQGLARSDDLLVAAERIALEGAGELDLPVETLDISCSLTLEGLPAMALKVYGSMDDPQVALDKPGALDIARHRVEQRRGALQDRAEQQRAQLQEELTTKRQDLRDDLREKSGEGVDLLLDHREQVIERRDDLRQQVQDARQGLRDQLRGTRQSRREGRAEGQDGANVPEEAPESSPAESPAEPISSGGP